MDRRPSPGVSLMDSSCWAAHKRAEATEAVHKQVHDAGRANVLGGLRGGNRGTLSASPSCALVVALPSLRVPALAACLPCFWDLGIRSTCTGAFRWSHAPRSLSVGAIVESQASKNLASALWRHFERKVTFSRLEW